MQEIIHMIGQPGATHMRTHTGGNHMNFTFAELNNSILNMVQSEPVQKIKLNGQNSDSKEQIITALQKLLPTNKKNRPIQQQLTQHKDEIKQLLNNPKTKMKLLTE